MGNQGFQGETRAPGSVVRGVRKRINYFLHLYATKQVSDNDNVHHKEGYRYYTQGNLTRTYTYE